MMGRTGMFALLVIGLPVALMAQENTPIPRANPADVGMDPALGRRLYSMLGGARYRGGDIGSLKGVVVAVGRNGFLVCESAAGNRTLGDNPEPMTADTIFDMASLTKPIATATCVMKLIERGDVRLEDPITKYLPELDRHGKRGITVEMLLRHRTGLIPDNPIGDYADGPEKAWEKIADLRLTAPPGDRFVYSDVNFLILGKLVEKVSGLTLDKAASAWIFEPLGMNDTGFLPKDKTRVAPTEPFEGEMLRGVVHDPRARALGGVAGHAGLFSTAGDLAKYAQMILNEGLGANGKRVLSPLAVRLMTDPGDTPPKQRRGLGWDLESSYSAPRGELFGPRSFGHTGFTGTSIWIDPDTKTYVIVLSSRLYPDGKGGSPTALRNKVATAVAASILDPSPAVAAAKPAPAPTVAQAISPVKCGIDVLIERKFDVLQGKSVGLVTNHTGLTRDGKPTIDVLAKAEGVKLVALFSPEHGIRGAVDREVGDDKDEATGLPIYSLYGKTRKPTPESLQGVDVLVYDIQDIGCRFYTYISTLGLVLEAAGAAKIPVIVLDRPNPIGGLAMAGPMTDPGKESFVAFHKLPVRHGMTIGELARMFNADRKSGADLTVIPCEGWRRGDLFDRTDLVWTNPSPNMRSLTEALLYPGVGLLEATNLATGRGTDTPFERVGAPYIADPARFAAMLNSLGLKGVRFVPTRFQPSERQFAGETCGGVYIAITDWLQFDPLDVGIGLAVTLRQLYPDDWKPEKLMTLMVHRESYDAIVSGKSLPAIKALWLDGLDDFGKARAPFLLYP
ncbi:MAG: DUF1343 domain-containing protein [Isosphaeraceae bacterium]